MSALPAYLETPVFGRRVMTASKSPKKAKSKNARKPQGEAKAAKLSALDAAAKVLGEIGKPMSCNEMIEAMATKGLLVLPWR